MASTRVDERLLREIDACELRLWCESCVHYEPESEGCSAGYPTAPHRARRLARGDALEFCKLFELA
ncbi:MAG: hypothetical protein OZ921_06695 [Sorangiineae bacterium]|nr:hypothetical protein [Polyangiaceae bacterium]MEB2322183.1 hypothetical protein [Sorangiineae bacterium]